METPKFDTWGIVEVMGHLKLAGHLTECQVAGSAFLRVDVPELDKLPAFSRLFGAGSIYSITPTTEQVARGIASTLRVAPLTQWDLPDDWKAKIRGLPSPATADHDEWEGDEFDDDEPSDDEAP